MNVVELIRVLQNKIASSTSAEDVLFLTKVMEKLNLGLVRTVSTYTELFNIPSKETLGEVYFVENEEKLYYRDISNGSFVWKTIFGNLNETAAYGWGRGLSGQLGDGTTTDKSSPVSVVGGYADWIQIGAGRLHGLGLRANGTAWAWGQNTNGRLGDNTTVDKNSPVAVAGGFTDWVQLGAERFHSLGVRANGTAWAWGAGSAGRLGDGTTTDKSSPVSVVGGYTDWVQLTGGQYHSLGVRADGTAWAWGSNGQGQLGDNSIVGKSSPVSVVGGYTDWVQLTGGQYHSLGVRADGTAWAWGVNTFGQLGDGTTVSKRSPISVIGGFTDWVQVSGGNESSIGLRANGTAWAWGGNGLSTLGDNTTVNKSSPVSVVGGYTDWVQLSSGVSHIVGLRANGTAWAWGINSQGRLGDNTTVHKSSPVSVVGGFTDWIQVSGGFDHSLAIRTL